ncbi:MAG: GNAT family N-acetyltransferase [Candidatus Thorarchaeota archaeon]
MSNLMRTKFTNVKINHYPANYQIILKLKNGKTLLIRPVKPDDEKMVEELHFSLDKKDWFFRFFSYEKTLGIKEIKSLVNINYNTDMVLVAECIEEEVKCIVAMGGFFKKMNPRVGELIFITRKNWRDLGITKALLKYLIKIARDLNYTKLGGVLHIDNKPMHHILNSLENKPNLKEIDDKFIAVLMDITK